MRHESEKSAENTIPSYEYVTSPGDDARVRCLAPASLLCGRTQTLKAASGPPHHPVLTLTNIHSRKTLFE